MAPPRTTICGQSPECCCDLDCDDLDPCDGTEWCQGGVCMVDLIDCNENGVEDLCDLGEGMSQDCDASWSRMSASRVRNSRGFMCGAGKMIVDDEVFQDCKRIAQSRKAACINTAQAAYYECCAEYPPCPDES